VCALLLACLFAYDIFWVFFHLPRPFTLYTHPHPFTPLTPQVCALLLACLFAYDIFWVFFHLPRPFTLYTHPHPFTPLTPQVCALLLACLFAYDIFWVFFSHRFFGANVMLSVATQHAHNPAHSVAHSLHLPSAVAGSIVREIELPVKLLFPRDLFGELNIFSGEKGRRAPLFFPSLPPLQAIPGMLLALVLCVDQHKRRQQQERQQERELEVLEAGKGGQEQQQEPHEHSQQHTQQHSKGNLSRPLLDSLPAAGEQGSGYLGYVWVAAVGYAVGLVAALAAGVLTRSPQPALLYLVCKAHSVL
ncbi:unnamed protein product, partial [Closterium sp. NIES-54]